MALPASAIFGAASSAAGMIFNSIGAYMQGKAQAAYYNAAAGTYDTNAYINDLNTARQAAYVNEAAASQVHNLRQQRQQTAGTAKAAMAAQGMDTGSGSAQAVLSSTDRAYQEDEELLRKEAEERAFEITKAGAMESATLRSQAKMARISAQQAKAQAKWNIFSTVLTGASAVGGNIFRGLEQ